MDFCFVLSLVMYTYIFCFVSRLQDRHDFEKASTLQNFVELWKCLLNELFISCYPKSLNSYKSSSVFSNSCRLEYMHFAVR